MSKKTMVQLTDIYVREAKAGKPKQAIEDELRKLGASEEDIGEVKKSIYRLGLLIDTDTVVNSRQRELQLIGWFLFIGGGLMTSLSYFGFWDLGNYFVIAWGPVIGGLGMIFMGNRRRGTGI